MTEPVITAWKAAHPSVSGHQGSYAMREIVNAIFYQGRTGCQRDYLPHDLPPRSAAQQLGTHRAPRAPHMASFGMKASSLEPVSGSVRQACAALRLSFSQKHTLKQNRGDHGRARSILRCR